MMPQETVWALQCRAWGRASLVTCGAMLMSGLMATSALAQHAPSSRWQQIDSDEFVIIFEEGNADTAQQVAADLEFYLPQMAETLGLGATWGPFPIVVSSSTHQSNGWVGLPGRSSYFYNKPAPFLGAGDWHTGLVIHEGRHIQQFSVAREGTLGAAMFYYAGESGTSAIISLLYPNWFLEGDAVLNETLWTPGGRGRVARFDLWLRARELSGQRDNFYRAYLGTGQDSLPYPDYYALGYLMVTYFNRHYGADFFADIMAGTGNLRVPLTFSGNIYRQTGMRLPEHYQRAMDELRDQWQGQLDNVKVSDNIAVLSPEPNVLWQSFMPVAITDAGPLFFTWDASQSPRLVHFADGNTVDFKTATRDMQRGYGRGERAISQGGHQLCWVRLHEHPRFQYVSYGDLACLDQDTAELTQHTDGRKLVAVAAHPQGDQWLVAEYTDTRDAHLEWLNAAGETLGHWPQPVGSYLHDLSWHADGQQAIFTRLDASGFSLHRLDVESGAIDALIAPTTDEVIRNAVYVDDWVFYTSDYTGIDQIWALNPDNGERYLVIQRPYGAYFPLWDPAQQRLLFSDYTPSGDRVAAYPLADQWPGEDWVPQAQVTPDPIEFFAPLLREHHDVAAGRATGTRPAEPKPVREYSRGQNALNVHSWGVGLVDDEASVSLASGNLLQTFDVNTRLGYHFRANQFNARLAAENRRWYPVLAGNVATDYLVLSREGVEQEWRQNEVTGTVSIPLRGWRYDLAYTLQPRAALSWIDLDSLTDNTSYNGTLLTLGASISQHRIGGYHDDRAGHVGYAADVRYSRTLDRLADFSWQEVRGDLRIGLPGIRPLDTVKMRVNLYDQQTGQDDLVPVFRTDSPQARGFRAALAGSRGGLLAADYRLPLGVVDWSLGNALYVRRLALKVSADHEFGDVDDRRFTQSSLGAAVVVPVNLLSNLNLQVDTEAGLYYQQETGAVALNIALGITDF